MSTETLNEELDQFSKPEDPDCKEAVEEFSDSEETREDSPAVAYYKELKREYDASLEKVHQAVANLRKPKPPSLYQWLKAVLKGEGDTGGGDDDRSPDLLEISGLEDARRIVENAPVAIAKYVARKYPDASLNLLLSICPLLCLEEGACAESGELNAATCYAEIKKSLEELKRLNIRKKRVYSIGVRYTLRSFPDAANIRALITGANKWSWFVGTLAGFLIGWFACGWLDPKKAELAGSFAGGFAGLIVAAILILMNEIKASKPVYSYFENIKHLRPSLEKSFLKIFYVVVDHVELPLSDKDKKDIEKMHRDALRGASDEPLYVHFLKIQSERYGRDSMELVETLRKLNDICQEQFRFQEAEPYLKQILEIYDKQPIPDYSQTIDTLHRLARLYDRLKDHEKEESLLHRARVLRGEQAEFDFRESVDPLHRLATLYRKTKEHGKERRMLEDALEICKKEAPNHILMARTMDKLGRYYRYRSDYKQAEHFFTNSLAILEELGLDNWETVDTLHRLAKFYCKIKEYDIAKPILERSLAICQKKAWSGKSALRKLRAVKALDRLEKKRKSAAAKLCVHEED